MPAFFGLSLGLLLTATAGWVDAIGFLRLGGLYPSFMSGNTTQLGVALSHEDWHLVEMAATILGLFFIGGFCGGLAAALPSSWRLPAASTAPGSTLIRLLPPRRFILDAAHGRRRQAMAGCERRTSMGEFG